MGDLNAKLGLEGTDKERAAWMTMEIVVTGGAIKKTHMDLCGWTNFN